MKKLLLSLMVLASLVSCGKDSAKNPIAPVAPIASVTNPIIINSVAGQDLLNRLNNPSSGFGTGILFINNEVSQECKDKWIFTVCTTTSSGSGTPTTWNALIASKDVTYQYITNGSLRKVLNSGVSVSQKQTDIKTLLEKANIIYGYAPIYTITVSGVNYLIDTSLPIQANPRNSGMEYYLNAI